MQKIELITDGEGNVLMFVNGQPIGNYSCGHYLDDVLEHELKSRLIRYYTPPLKEDDE